MITDVEDYFAKGCGRCDRFATPACSARAWAQGLGDLRRLCRDTGLVETVKWGHPCYMHAGRNIAIIGAFRDGFRLSFFDAALLKDPEGVLERQGPNTRHPDMIRFDRTRSVADRETVVRTYLREAMGYAEKGIKPLREEAALELPDELIAALDGDPGLAEAFHALTPGRQRSYAIALGSAKTAATSIARIAKLRSRILAGKGALER
ncbi:YdeI/OmpD-associated family protein [Rubellimicrobium arenae]|uniref:YdeI/OmpD-associated family protein n=1 Tax=Rubellimicrobium arenae TaxID=2817372 RepID=UPI001B306A17|nr:YdeI/OmpD-associated family protein [Rubellimicrobium arenae]